MFGGAGEINYPSIGASGASTANAKTITQNGHGFVLGQLVYPDATNTWQLAIADSNVVSNDSFATEIVTKIVDANTFEVSAVAFVDAILAGIASGDPLYLSQTIPGTFQNTKPTSGYAQHLGYYLNGTIHFVRGQAQSAESATASTSFNWDNNITDAGGFVAEKDNGYTAESGLTSLVYLPNTGNAEGDRIGFAADENSELEIKIQGQTNIYQFLTANQSIIFRYDSSKTDWLVESSHLIETVTASTVIYVDGFANAGGDGSVFLPYNTLESAISYIIGSGTVSSPQYANMTAIVTAGIFNVQDINMAINGVKWDMADSVVVNFSTAIGTLGAPKYLFENTVGAYNFLYEVIGGAKFYSLSEGAGILYAKGTQVTAQTNTVNYNYINFSCAVIESLVNVLIPVCPLIKADCATEENNGRRLLDLDCTRIVGGDATPLFEVGQGANVSVKNATIASHFNTNNRSKLVLRITDCYQFFATDCIIGGAASSKHVSIAGTNDTIKFVRCQGYIYDGPNDSLYTNNIIKLESNFALTNKFSSAKSFGLYLEECYTLNELLRPNNNVDSVYGYFLFKRDASDTAFQSFTADLKNNDLGGIVSTYTNGFFNGTAGSFGTISKFRSNIMVYDLFFDKTLVYSNLPSSPTGLPTGAIYQDANQIKIV